MRVRFGDCLFDSEARQLVRDGRPTALSPKAMALLEDLLEARPGAVRKQALWDRLWPRTFVSHTSLARVVNELRRAIGDDPEQPRFVRTVRGFGYAWDGEAVEVGRLRPIGSAGPSGHTLRWGAQEIPLHDGENLLGRDAECTVRVTSPGVSRRHARIVVSGSRAILEDLGSKNGTYLNGKPARARTILSEGDEILLGRELLVYCSGQPTGTTRTVGLDMIKR